MSNRAILTYHAIEAPSSPTSIAPSEFRRQIETLAASDIRVLPLADLIRASEPAVALTFDDGDHSFLAEALPLLDQYKLPATVFLITSTLDGDSHEGRNRLSWADAETLRLADVTLGAHTATHPNLADLPHQQAKREILDSQHSLEDRFGKPITQFCYPYGSSTGAIRDFVREHFELACSTELDFVSSASKREHLERLDTYYLRGRRLDQLFARSTRAYIGARRFLRRRRQAIQGMSS